MSFVTLNTNLFKPISGENGLAMLAMLDELEAFLDPALLEEEPSPSQARSFLRDYISNKNLSIEIETGEKAGGASAPEQYMYTRLRETGWLREEQDSGYRFVVWMAQDARRLLHFLSSMSSEHPSLGVVCLSVRSSLSEVVKDPANGSLVRKAADDMVGFLNRLRALVGNIREIHHFINGGNEQSDSNFSFYFDEYLGELFLPNMEKLALKGNPNLHSSEIRKLVNSIRFNPSHLEACSKAYHRDNIINPSIDLVVSDLDRLSKAFDAIDPLFKKTQNYARRITRRMHEKIKYTVHTPSNIGQKIQGLMDRIAENPELKELPSLSIGEELLAEQRLAKPKSKPIPPAPSVRREKKPLWKKRASSQLKQEHINFQKYDPDRVAGFIEKHLIGRDKFSTDDLIVETDDDMLALLHLRLLAHGVSKTHPLQPLQSIYSVCFDEAEWSELKVMAGRRLLIARRSTMENTPYGK